MSENVATERMQRLALVALALYTLILLAATHVPQPPDELIDLAGSDKTLHFAAYAVLALLTGVNLALRGWFRASTALWVFVFLALFGALDEVTQPFVGRQADVRDWGADVAGLVGGMVAVVLGIVGYRYLRRKPGGT